MTDNAPSAAHRQESHASRLSDRLTQVELTWYEKRIENWIRFGDYVEEKILDRRRRTLGFRSGTVFAFVRWSANDFGTVSSRIDIVRAVAARESYQTLSFVRPGGEILLHIDSWPKVERVLQAIDAVEAIGVENHQWPDVDDLEVFASDASGESVLSLTTRSRRPLQLPSVDSGLVVNGRVARRPERLAFRVLQRHYEVSAGVFWQVHPGAANALARAVLNGLDARPGDRVADLFAGAGLFAGLVGDVVGPTGSVLAVERDRWACADATRNTVDQPHVEVLRAAVTSALVSERLGGVDLLVLDPSREGAGRPVMSSLVALSPGPRRIVYVACDPASFARDLRVVLDAGWALHSLRAFDLFPMTEHVETVAVVEPPQVRATNAL